MIGLRFILQCSPYSSFPFIVWEISCCVFKGNDWKFGLLFPSGASLLINHNYISPLFSLLRQDTFFQYNFSLECVQMSVLRDSLLPVCNDGVWGPGRKHHFFSYKAINVFWVIFCLYSKTLSERCWKSVHEALSILILACL